MKNSLQYKLVVLILLSAVFLFCSGNCLAAHKAKVVKKTQPVQVTNPDPVVQFYQKAQVDLDKQVYRIYRVAERIIRANKLDEYPWTIEVIIDKNYKIAAHTNTGNLIVLYDGDVNTLSDDVSMLAFVISHEMAHEIQRHLAKYSRNYAEKVKEIQAAQTQYNNEMKKDIKNLYWLSFLMGIGTYGYSIDKMMDNTDKFNEMIKESRLDLLTMSRNHEYEADKIGLQMMIRAGFDPKSSVKVFEFLKRMPVGTSDENSTHPPDQNRIWQIQKVLKSTNIADLKKQGNRNIAVSKPLNYKLSLYKNRTYISKKSLLIHSKYDSGEDINKPFRDLFGK